MRAVFLLCLVLVGCGPVEPKAFAPSAPSFQLPPLKLTLPAEEGVVRIDDEVNGGTVTLVEEALALNPKRLRIEINSPGGSVFAGLKIIKMIRDAGIPTTCVVEDMAASMAAVILQSPACGHRVVQSSSILMFHETSMPYMGTITEQTAESMYQVARAINRAIASIVAARIGISVEEYISKVSGKEWYIVGLDAVQSGVADEVLGVKAPVLACQ